MHKITISLKTSSNQEPVSIEIEPSSSASYCKELFSFSYSDKNILMTKLNSLKEDYNSIKNNIDLHQQELYKIIEFNLQNNTTT